MSTSTLYAEPEGSAFALVRRARRLRAVFRREPGRMHAELRNLSKSNQSPTSYQTPAASFAMSSRPLVSPTPGTAASFAELVEGEIQGGILRYSARLSLLKQAALMKIERFEANLIIAAVENRFRPRVRPARAAGRPLTAGAIAVILAVTEGVLVAVGWWLFIH
ncbi:MAG: hypothetical protein ABSH22_02440 [Tepidisphaeraceae bacterium]